MFAIYGREKNKHSKFKPLNLDEGCFEERLIYASVFKNRIDAEKVCIHLIKNNEDVSFVVRKVDD